MTRRTLIPVGLCWLLTALAGCNTDSFFAKEKTRTGPVTTMDSPDSRLGVPDVTVVSGTEYDLVEQVLTHRTGYHQSLVALRDYYRKRGYQNKLQWAEFELADVEKIKPFKYLLDAEIPAPWLQPKDSIGEADALYERGCDLMKKGGHGVPVFYSEDVMRDALKCFVELVQKYPSSDKIDDAAFGCGEIYKEYFKDQNEIAVKWYERAFTWDPQTPHPARFQAAVVYDYRLHDRARALELYHEVLKNETSNLSNARWASNRIDELTKGPQLATPRPPEAQTREPEALASGDSGTASTPEPSESEDTGNVP
jgi:tetratricopeptide (TPR) repeat protein